MINQEIFANISFDIEKEWPWGVCKVKEMNFTDLFVSHDEVDIKGIRDKRFGNIPQPITRSVPKYAFVDLDTLVELVVQRTSEEEFMMDYDGMRFRCTRINDVSKNWFNLRRSQDTVPALETLGLGNTPAFNSALVKHIIEVGSPRNNGLLIICGAMGHGKTTTACSILKEWLVQHGDVAVTVEDPPEMVMNYRYGVGGRCYQTQAPNGDFGEAMRLTVRRSPRFILLGETRGPIEAREAIRAAINGQIVISTIHAPDIIGGINAILKLVSGKEDLEMAQGILGDGLIGVIHQQLVKKKDRDNTIITPVVESLFFPSGSGGIRTLIKTNKFSQLSTEIAAQNSKMSQGLSPLAIV